MSNNTTNGHSFGEPPPLPVPRPKTISDGITILPPLSRRGVGPGLILFTPTYSDSLSIKNGVPSPLIKWAEEGYCVMEIQSHAEINLEHAPRANTANTLIQLLSKLLSTEGCDGGGRIGLMVYSEHFWNDPIADEILRNQCIRAVSIYSKISSGANGVLSDRNANIASPIPIMLHVAGSGEADTKTPQRVRYNYPNTKSGEFAMPFTEEFHYATEAVSHTRNLTFLKKHIGGPDFDLEAIWDEHTKYEFAERSVEWTMSTMVQEPYVNHIPTMTGGIGREALTEFYTHHFIFSNPPDAHLELISRTVGIDRVVDEFIFNLTHTKEVPWLIPGIPPTGKKLAVPMTAIVNIRGDRLYHEHINWDQGTVLRQLGLMPDVLPFVDPLKGEENLMYTVPVAGVETAEKMRDKNRGESNEMFKCEMEERK